MIINEDAGNGRGTHRLLTIPRAATLESTRPTGDSRGEMSWALEEFFSAVEEEFGVTVGDANHSYLDRPGAVIDFIAEATEPADGMSAEEHRDHVAGIVGEIMARTLGVTRYSEGSRFVEDLRVR